MGLRISPFKPEKATRGEWKLYHRFRRLRHEETDPGDPLLSDETVEKQMGTPDPEWEELYFYAAKDDHEGMVAWLELGLTREGSISHSTNSHLVWSNIEVLPNHRKQGIGKRMLVKASDVAEERSRSVLIGGSHEPSGKAFIDAIGAQVAHQWRQSRLSMDEVDWRRMTEWVEAGERRSPDTRLRFFANYPNDNIIKEYCQLLQEVSNQEPRGDLDLGDEFVTPEILKKRVASFTESGGSILRAVTQEKGGDLSGLTTMGYYPDEKTLIHQWMTGVKDIHRGRGLGKWLKAAMLLHIRELFPQVRAVVTGNATSNAPMLSINVRLGFRPHKEGVEAQINVKELREYLGR